MSDTVTEKVFRVPGYDRLNELTWFEEDGELTVMMTVERSGVTGLLGGATDFNERVDVAGAGL